MTISPIDEKGVNRVKNSLVRYGYDYSDINKALKDIASEDDDDE